MSHNLFIRSRVRVVLILIIFIGATGIKSWSQTNMPDNSSAPAAVTVNIQGLPGAYPTGMPVSCVRTWQPLKPYTSEADVISSSRMVQEVNRTTQYLDGLGRPLQSVAWQAAPGKLDIVTPVLYDDFGREKYKYLPFAMGNTGAFNTNPFSEAVYSLTSSDAAALRLQYPGESVFYSQVDFEASPLNRVNKTMAAGNSWAGSDRGIQVQYQTNAQTEDVRIWDIDMTAPVGDALNIPFTGAAYGDGKLSKITTTNESGSQIIEYKDEDGRTILKKVQASASVANAYDGWLCTYYVYDDLDRLRFVIPPKAVIAWRQANWNLIGNVLSEVVGLCFRYEYDARNRVIAKKVPDAGWVYMVYDKRDRLAYIQDANMRSGGKSWWLATLYDHLNRPVQTAMLTGYTGTWAQLTTFVNGLSTEGSAVVTTFGVSAVSDVQDLVIDTWQANVNYNAGNSISFQPGFSSGENAEFLAEIVAPASVGFTSQQNVTGFAVPSGGTFVPLTYNYYDKYEWGTSKQYDASNNNKLGIGSVNVYGDPLPSSKSNFTQGVVTGTRVRVLEDADDLTKGNWLETVSFYDDKGRVIQVISDNYKGGRDVVTSRYDFTGKVVSSYHVHNTTNTGITNSRDYTETDYDHAGRVVEIRKTLNDDAATTRIIAHNTYDVLGRLKQKQLGKKAGAADWLETQDYAYNIRGWLKGINWTGYGNGGKTIPVLNRWFAMDLSYDWGYSNNQFNGNIAGMRWQSAGDQKERGYGFGYDAANRLLFADFKQYDGSWNVTAGVDYSMHIGDETTNANAYDANGNILKMWQKGFKGIATSDWIDKLTYTYTSNSNRLKGVTDAAENNANSKLGDYHTPSGITPGYTYDGNGNMVRDLNKLIGTGAADGIKYNHLNLPYKIMVGNAVTVKGTITYVYDATGNKLEKRTKENAASYNNNTEKTTVTSYLNGYVYENEILQHMGHEEGRIRAQRDDATGAITAYIFDYFLKDHLGNVRTIITDEVAADRKYTATMEDALRSSEISLFDKLSETLEYKPVGFDNDGNNFRVSKLTSGAGSSASIGPGIVLKVMKGDKFTAAVKGWYLPGTSAGSGQSLAEVINSIASAFIGGIPATGAHGAAGSLQNSNLNAPLTSFVGLNHSQTTGPKAYLNWILLDEQQFQLVQEGSGAKAMPEITGSMQRQVLQSNFGDDIEISRNGYLYVYVSNESAGNVYFDDLTVTHKPGALLEETHYYPFGLVQANISSKAVGKLKNNRLFNKGSELQHEEWSDGSGLELYDTYYRQLDPQIGRWNQIDPKVELGQESVSPYVAMADNPLLYNDPLGDLPDDKKKKKKKATPSPTPSPAPQPDSATNTGTPKKQTLPEMKENPPNVPGYVPPKSGARKVRNPAGRGTGWIDRNGRVWVPDNHDGTHAPHWDVQDEKGGGYEPVYPVVAPAVPAMPSGTTTTSTTTPANTSNSPRVIRKLSYWQILLAAVVYVLDIDEASKGQKFKGNQTQ